MLTNAPAGGDSQRAELARLGLRIFAPKPKLTVTEFCEQNIYLPPKLTQMPGPFRSSLTPYLPTPLNCFDDPKVTDLTFCWATQVAKTTLLMLGMGYRIINRPSNTLWIMPTVPVARSFNRRRWHPFINENKVLAEQKPNDADLFTLLEQHFPRFFIKFCGSNSIADLIESPVQCVVYDEVDAGAQSSETRAGSDELADERTKAFSNALRIKASSPTKEPSPIWSSLQSGTHERYAVPCPECAKPIFLDWRHPKDGSFGVQWSPRARLADGRWDLALVMETAHYVCPECGFKINDGHKTAMLRAGQWMATNPNPGPGHRSFQLGSIYSPWITFGAIANKWLKSQEALFGLQIFINGWLGEVWREHESEEIEFPESDYAKEDLWPEETHRLFTIDKQKDHVWALARAWNSRTGESRLIWEGSLPNEDEAREIQKKLGIADPLTLIDHGYMGTEVARICARYGWTALKGDDRAAFLHQRLHGQPAVAKPYAPKTKLDPYIGTANQGKRFVRLHLWSNPSIKDTLYLFKDGKGPAWKLPRDISAEYLDQIGAEVKVKRYVPSTGKEVWQWIRVKGKNGRPKDNHLFDCECMQIVGALLCGFKLQAAAGPPVEPEAA